MNDDWTSPSSRNRLHEIAAAERDRRDLDRLRSISVIINKALLGLSVLDQLEHPAARFSIIDAAGELRGILRDVEGTEHMIRNEPLLVTEDA